MASYGAPPYHETAFRAALRAAAAGLSSIPRGANFGQSLIAGFGGAEKAYSASEQAARDYAMKQAQMEEAAKQREIQNRYTEALIKRAERPEKPPPAPKTPTNVLDMTPEQFELYRRRHAALRPPKAAAKEKGPPKPRAAVLKRIDAINASDPLKPGDRNILEHIVANPPTPEEKAAAQLKLSILRHPY